MSLINTVRYMESGDPSDKFRAEFYQTAIRYLKALRELERGEFSIPRDLLQNKVDILRKYLTELQAESVIRGIPVSIDDVRGGGTREN